MQESLLALLAGRRGHFRMESGYHSERWFDLDGLLADRDRLAPYVAELARRLAAHRPDAICGPMTGGAQLAALIGVQLGLDAFITERFVPPDATGLFPVRYQVPVVDRPRLRGKTVAIVDDAISAGSAVRGTCLDVRACGATPVAFGALFVFGDAADALATAENVKLDAVARMRFGMWPPSECPLCRAGEAIESVSDAPPPT